MPDRVKRIRKAKKQLLFEQDVYETKYAEYMLLSLDELRTIFSDKSKRIGGTYKRAIIDICSIKMQEEKDRLKSTSSPVSDTSLPTVYKDLNAVSRGQSDNDIESQDSDNSVQH